MEVHFTPEQEARISELASSAGMDAEHLVKDAVLRMLEEDAQVQGGVDRGIAADCGDFVESAEVWANVEKLLQS
jgi:predicted transcriptional regulator